ncbi:integrator complex subunit 3 isoform X1 [Hydra vulgaris]|uniref:integrator complex subunit 3 isoform X1 n=1 Tax=Hydra vulgaris TaxID=6087 RepID=UPI001F5FE7E8|nr:integrator complex subunit 3 isoform X1 [Hydra vulgaris]
MADRQASELDEVLPKPTKIFLTNFLQGKDELEDRLEKSHVFVSSLVIGLSEREIHDALIQAVCKGIKEQEDIYLGLLYTILTDQINAPKAYRDLSFVSRDGLGSVVNKIHCIFSEKFSKLLELPKAQMLWLLGEMMKNHILNLEPVIYILLRQIAGGDLSQGNITYTENVLKLLRANRAWLDKNLGTLQVVIYTFVRIIEDHESARFKILRQAEIDFCIQLIREHFAECMAIGKDFVRLLQNIFRIPEFMQLWKDILYRPQSLCTQFQGLEQLLMTRTHRKFLQSRITPDMENKIAFLALKVKFGQQKRYQDWFFKQYLSASENQTLLPDLVRFICGVIHPPNEILGSEVIPRWAIVGWLYTAGQNPVSQANMKLSLFFDWLFFQGDKDNIMNIEPAILLMHNSVRTHPSITYILLDFICRMSTQYCPQHVHLTKLGIFNSFRSVLDKRVVSSLAPILKSHKIHQQLKQLLVETLPSFLEPNRPEESVKVDSPPHSPSNDKDYSLDSTTLLPQTIEDEIITDEAVFSDEDDDEKIPPPPPSQVDPVTEKKFLSAPSSASFRPITIKEEDFKLKTEITKHHQFDGVDVTDLEEFQNLDSNLLKDNVLKLQNQKNESSEAMEAIISNIESMGDFDEEIASPLCVCLANVLADELSLPVMPSDHYKLTEDVAEKAIESKLDKPQYVIFRSICALSKNDINLENIYTLLNGIHEIDRKIGYHFLFFLKACYKDDEKLSVYEDYVNFFKDRTLKSVLLQDLKICYEYDPHLFMFLIESMFKRFKNQLVGNEEIIRMLVSTIHPDEMNSLISNILMGNLSIIGENQVVSLLESSLSWTSFEQSFLWQLILAEKTPAEMCVGILPLVDEKKHYEPLNQLLLILRSESPHLEIIKPILCMKLDGCGKKFSLCLFKTWCQEDARELAHVIAQMLSKNVTKKSKSQKFNPSVEQILCHLNNFYNHCVEVNDMKLFQYESLRYALTNAKKSITDTNTKTKCKSLLSEFNELPDRMTRKRKTKRLTRNTKNVGKLAKSNSSDSSESENEDEASEEDSEDENNVQSQNPPSKKRKKSKTLSSEDED